MEVIKISVKKAAAVYKKLTDYEYKIVLVRNRQSEPITLLFSFPKEGFSHLCGLHKLTDINELNSYKVRQNIVDRILSGVYPDTLFEKSAYYDMIEDRVECLERLDSILDSSNTIFKYNSIKRNATLIDFDFLIKQTDTNGRYYYLTVENNEKKGLYCGCSCFKRTNNETDFSKGHTSYYVLQKNKKNLITGEEIELYIAPSYKKQLDNEKKEVSQRVSEQEKNNPFTIIEDQGYTVLTECKDKAITTVEIPAGVTWINPEAFAGCYNLKSVTIPDGVEGIAQAAFYGCENLESVEISDSVVRVGDYAFAECKNLWNVNVPADLQFDGERCDFDKVFSGTPFLEEWQNGNGSNLNNDRGR